MHAFIICKLSTNLVESFSDQLQNLGAFIDDMYSTLKSKLYFLFQSWKTGQTKFQVCSLLLLPVCSDLTKTRLAKLSGEKIVV